jgi:hypothetical protein
LHDPEVAAIVRDVLDKLRMWWVRAVRCMADEGRLPAGTDAEAAGSALFTLVPGFLPQYLILGSTDADALRRGLRILLRTECRPIPPAAPTKAHTGIRNILSGGFPVCSGFPVL